MAYILRIVQRFDPQNRAEYLRLEQQFAAMEQERSDFPRGRRSLPLTGREPTNTLIWEASFPTQAAAQSAMAQMADDARHEALFQQQVQYIKEAFVEIYEVLEL